MTLDPARLTPLLFINCRVTSITMASTVKPGRRSCVYELHMSHVDGPIITYSYTYVYREEDCF